MKQLLASGCILFLLYSFITFNSGCAQISAPTGGDKDTIAPVLLKSSPPNGSLNFKGNRITLSFDEYITVQDLQQNLLVSPLQKNNPVINYNFREINIKFRDTLLPNTTYSINFGNAIQDLNENNPLGDFTYTFSTGDVIDSLSLTGKVTLAETGKTDSTLIVMLYRNAADTAVLKTRPSYIAKVKGDGTFVFNNLPADNFRVYALKDGDGGKTYNSKTETFAFTDNPVTVDGSNAPVTLNAYEEIKDNKNPATKSLKPAVERRLRFTTNLEAFSQDVLEPLEIQFNNPIKNFTENLVSLTDTNYRVIPASRFAFDSTRKILTVSAPWRTATAYRFLIGKDAVEDSAGNKLMRADTIRFDTKTVEDYGTVTLRFKNLELSRKPVLQFINEGEVQFSFPLVSSTWTDKMFPPGEYEMRILYDSNSNGKWDPGNYTLKLQPEIAISLKEKLQIRANWENEREINL